MLVLGTWEMAPCVPVPLVERALSGFYGAGPAVNHIVGKLHGKEIQSMGCGID